VSDGTVCTFIWSGSGNDVEAAPKLDFAKWLDAWSKPFHDYKPANPQDWTHSVFGRPNFFVRFVKR
jgi:hypothetical protein